MKYLFFLLLLISNIAQSLIILDPIGDNTSSRIIDHDFEAGLTLQCAQAITQSMTSPIVLTRTAGKSAMPFPERQSFANRSNAQFYFSISFYVDTQPTIALYYHCAYPATDFWQFPYHTLATVPFDQIHRRTIHQSAKMAERAADYLHKNSTVLIQDVIGIPIAELQGLTCPALKCEIGLVHASQWHDYVPLLSSLITHLLATP